MGRTLNRVAGAVSAAALATFAAAPVALAEETSTSPTETTTPTSETSTSSSSPTSTASETPTTVPSSTSGIATSKAAQPEVKTTDKRIAPKAAPAEIKGDTQEPPKQDDYQDNVGQGFVGLGGEGVLVINCAAGAPGNLATQYLSVTGGPDQDGADGRIWNYTVRVADAPAGTTTAKFSWTCVGVEGNGTVEFQQPEEPPTTSTSSSPTTTSAPASSTAPVTSAPATTTATTASGNAAPKAQVKVTPKGKIETGFGGTAW